ncbi:MAG: ABC-F family ATP-binding cassette domain-containing protein [Anaerolineae bacterium]
MALITLNNVAKSFGAADIFAGVSASIPHGARLALVGSNGVGKTTLLNLIVGLDTPTAGSITRASGIRIGFLPQRPELSGDHTLIDEMLSVFGPLREMEARLAELERQMAANPDDPALIDTYGNLQHRYEHAGGFEYGHRIKMVLTGLGFTEDEYVRPLSKLSGGERTRALLGRLLLEAPDLLVLDEPTNHLDIDAVEWLEGFLKSFSGAVLIVSHDRYFMDRVITTIWELAFGRLEVYRGNYSHYAIQREERHERLRKEYEAQQERIEKEMEYIRRNMGRQRTSQAKGKIKKLETMVLGKARGDLNRLEAALRGELPAQGSGLLNAPRQEQHMRMRLEAALRSGDKVLMTYDLGVGYPDGDLLFTVPDITLYRGEVAALIGPNGVGKTTFLKTVLGKLPPKQGGARLGASVQVGYFAQAHEELNPNNSILDEIFLVRQMPMSQARSYLATYLFTGDDVLRPIGTLSGGERGRVALAKLALSGANFLLLDEPTNHLDIASQEILEEVLQHFNGTILMVSHDRYLIDRLATQIWVARPGELIVFEGSYAEYIAARDGTAQAGEDGTPEERAVVTTRRRKTAESRPSSEREEAPQRPRLSPYQRAQRTALLENVIEELEARLVDLSGAIGEASAAGDATRVHDLGLEYTRAEQELEAAMQEWEALLLED